MFVAGLGDFVIAWIPLRLGSPEWEFGTVASTLAGLPLATMGLAGLLGSGRTETAKLLYGIDRPDAGELKIDGLRASIRSPAEAIRYGLAFCSEDRKREGIIPNLSVRENLLLAMQALINLSVALCLLPTKGMALPLVSYGGSSLIANLAAVGVLLNLSQQST